MLVSLSFTKELLSWGGVDRSLRILYIRVAFVWKRLVSSACYKNKPDIATVLMGRLARMQTLLCKLLYTFSDCKKKFHSHFA